MNWSIRNICLTTFSCISAIALLYLALYISPDLYRPAASSVIDQIASVAGGIRPFDSAEMTIRASKFTPE